MKNPRGTIKAKHPVPAYCKHVKTSEVIFENKSGHIFWGTKRNHPPHRRFNAKPAPRIAEPVVLAAGAQGGAIGRGLHRAIEATRLQSDP